MSSPHLHPSHPMVTTALAGLRDLERFGMLRAHPESQLGTFQRMATGRSLDDVSQEQGTVFMLLASQLGITQVISALRHHLLSRELRSNGALAYEVDAARAALLVLEASFESAVLRRPDVDKLRVIQQLGSFEVAFGSAILAAQVTHLALESSGWHIGTLLRTLSKSISQDG